MEVLYDKAYKQIGLDKAKLVESITPLIGFSADVVAHRGGKRAGLIDIHTHWFLDGCRTFLLQCNHWENVDADDECNIFNLAPDDQEDEYDSFNLAQDDQVSWSESVECI